MKTHLSLTGLKSAQCLTISNNKLISIGCTILYFCYTNSSYLKNPLVKTRYLNNIAYTQSNLLALITTAVDMFTPNFKQL